MNISQGTWSGRPSFGCGCVQRQLSPQGFVAVNAEHIYALSFHQERYPAKNRSKGGSDLQVRGFYHSLRTSLIERIFSTSRPMLPLWVALVLVLLTSMGGPRVPPIFKCMVFSTSRPMFPLWVGQLLWLGVPDLPLLPGMETKFQGHLRQRALYVEKVGYCWDSKARSYRMRSHLHYKNVRVHRF